MCDVSARFVVVVVVVIVVFLFFFNRFWNATQVLSSLLMESSLLSSMINFY